MWKNKQNIFFFCLFLLNIVTLLLVICCFLQKKSFIWWRTFFENVAFIYLILTEYGYVKIWNYSEINYRNQTLMLIFS